MLWRYFIKVIIADRAVVLVNTVFDSYEKYGMVCLAVGVIAFAIQIYCDFVGYSSIAIGVAQVAYFPKHMVLGFNAIYAWLLGKLYDRKG